MITGGLGFIGSNLAHRLVDLRASVVIVDSLLPGAGGNWFNIAAINRDVDVHVVDVRHTITMPGLVREQEVIFNLAGQVSHIDSLTAPDDDLEINCRSQLHLLEACRHHNPDVKIVYAGTRQVYGRPATNPVRESHPVQPVDVNGVDKAAAESYHFVYASAFGLRVASLRLTNTYGPRQLIKHDRQGFLPWFIRQAVEKRDICIYGAGTQARDFVFVDDAVDAFLRVGADDGCNGEYFNVGGDEALCHADVARLLIEAAGGGSIKHVDWPAGRAAIDIGTISLDSSKLRARTGWQPRVQIQDGLARTVAFYRQHLCEYLPAAVDATCDQ
jgi:UDP-glucose 4-epimerase